jgi:hypothetical protein
VTPSTCVLGILEDAAAGMGKYKNLSPDERSIAKELLDQYKRDPQSVSGTAVGVDLKNNEIHVSPWPGRPGTK